MAHDLTLNKVFHRAATGALIEWGLEGMHEDLVQDLWVWYLRIPSVQHKMAELSEPEKIVTAKIYAHQLISEKVLEGNAFSGASLYSSDCVRDVLGDQSRNVHLKDLVPIALERLDKRNPEQAEAIRSRYQDGLVPVEPAKSMLKRGVKALTEEVNIICLTSDNQGTGSRDRVFPGTRKRKGEHGEPTADLAIGLIYNGDEEIELLDNRRQPTGETTTYRKEFYG